MQDLHLLSAKAIAELVNGGSVKAVEICKLFLERAQRINPTVKAFNCFTSELAYNQAKSVDDAIAQGQQLPLAGVPVAIKDNLCVTGTTTTCSSNFLSNFVAPYESTATARLWAAGALCIGKTNLDEFAMGSSTENSAFGPTANPWDESRVPGGSSGGSAAAVASRMVPIALGSDTGGSIRQPAALCGILGMKPTYGLVSRYGLIAFASSLDQIGPFALDAGDADLLLKVIAGHDPKDSTSLECNYEQLSTSPNKIQGLRVGVLSALFEQDKGVSIEVATATREVLKQMQSHGAQLEEIEIPLITDHALDVYYVIAPAEASSNLARFDGIRYGKRTKQAPDLLSCFQNSRGEGFGREVTRRIMIGTYALSSGYYDAYYKKAQAVRALICTEFSELFKRFDILISPTSPCTAFPKGAKTSDPLAMYLCDISTIPVNLAGLPAVSLNCGFDAEGLPIGLQIIGPHLSDRSILNIAKQLTLQENCDRLPSIC